MNMKSRGAVSKATAQYEDTSSTILEVLNSLLLRQQKLEQVIQFQSNKIDELLDRQFTNDKVMHRIQSKLDKLNTLAMPTHLNMRTNTHPSRLSNPGERKDEMSQQSMSEYYDNTLPMVGPTTNNFIEGDRLSEPSDRGQRQLSRVQSQKSNTFIKSSGIRQPEPVHFKQQESGSKTPALSERQSESHHSTLSNSQPRQSMMAFGVSARPALRQAGRQSLGQTGLQSLRQTGLQSYEERIEMDRSLNSSPHRQIFNSKPKQAHNQILNNSNSMNLTGEEGSRRKSHSFSKAAFASKVMVQPHEHNNSINQFLFKKSSVIARFTGWYQLLMNKPLNTQYGEKCYFELKIIKSYKFNLMVGICALDRLNCTTSYNSGHALALNLWNFHLYSKAGAERMKMLPLELGSILRVELDRDLVNWYIDGQFVTRAIIPPELRQRTLVGYIEMYDKDDEIRLN